MKKNEEKKKIETPGKSTVCVLLSVCCVCTDLPPLDVARYVLGPKV